MGQERAELVCNQDCAMNLGAVKDSSGQFSREGQHKIFEDSMSYKGCFLGLKTAQGFPKKYGGTV